MTVEFIDGKRVEGKLDWLSLTFAIEAGHRLPKAQIGSTMLRRGDDTVLSLTAWIDGLGIAVKTPTVFPGNAGQGESSINGGFCLYSDATGVLEAVIDFHLITKWKTAADSLLGARKLARQDTGEILIVGAGVVARSMVEAYRAGFPDARLIVWSRRRESAQAVASDYGRVTVADDLEKAVRKADIICCATMSTEPLILGEWLRPGQHVDLIGSYRPDMREADSAAVQRARVFVDGREMTSKHSGDLLIPVSEGVIGPDHVLGDFFDIGSGKFARRSDDEITMFKNAGGAHLDLMAARYILDVWQSKV